MFVVEVERGILLHIVLFYFFSFSNTLTFVTGSLKDSVGRVHGHRQSEALHQTVYAYVSKKIDE